jgi:hypothetical protein
MKKELTIVVLPRGWVMVGEAKEKNNKLELTNASVIRRWGTTKGLPELANDGPLSSTVLDGKCEMEFPMSSIIAQIKCNTKAWSKY